MPFLNHRLSRRFFLKGASAATAAGALTLQAQVANADETPKTTESPAPAEETKGPRLTIQRATITEDGMTVSYTAHGLRELLTEGTTLTVRHGYVRDNSFETLRSWPLTPEFNGDEDTFSGTDLFPIELIQPEGVDHALQLDICTDPWGQEIAHQVAARIPVVGTKILKTSFEDVPGNYPYADDIRVANQKKWLFPNPQTGAFEPNRAVTREEAIALLNRAAGRPGVSENSEVAPYADAVGRPAANALHWARDRKITEPIASGERIDPTAPISHEELMAVLYQYNAEVQLSELEEGAGSRFRDVLGAGPLHRYVAWAGANDIVLDSSGEFKPTAPTTRAELARFIRRYKLQNLLFTDFSYIS